MTTAEEIKNYIEITEKWIVDFLIIGAFSENAPTKCSGLDIKQYSENQLEGQFSNRFKKLKYMTEDHVARFETKQNFTFCAF